MFGDGNISKQKNIALKRSKAWQHFSVSSYRMFLTMYDQYIDLMYTKHCMCRNFLFSLCLYQGALYWNSFYKWQSNPIVAIIVKFRWSSSWFYSRHGGSEHTILGCLILLILLLFYMLMFHNWTRQLDVLIYFYHEYIINNVRIYSIDWCLLNQLVYHIWQFLVFSLNLSNLSRVGTMCDFQFIGSEEESFTERQRCYFGTAACHFE